MEIYFVTSNKVKVKNASEALAHFGIKIKQYHFDFVESRSEDPKEIALEKAKQAYSIFKKPVIVEDSGFFIEALDGFPMTHVKFSLQTIGIKHILKALVDEKNRKVYWKMTVAYCFGKNKFKIFNFVEKGEIATELRPAKRLMMSEYWRVYIPKMIKNNELALSEMEDDDLKAWKEYFSRNNHFMKFGSWLNKQK